MNKLGITQAQCPYCWEKIELVIDCSVAQQQYIEDCQVCCHPMEVTAVIDETGNVRVELAREND